MSYLNFACFCTQNNSLPVFLTCQFRSNCILLSVLEEVSEDDSVDTSEDESEEGTSE